MIILSVCLLLRVRAPLVGLPHGVTGWRPPEVRPSPPPCGWSTGFLATPRVSGRLPIPRRRPAFASVWLVLSGFDTAPTVPMHPPRIQRCPPEQSRTLAKPRSRPTPRDNTGTAVHRAQRGQATSTTGGPVAYK